ncbi:MAG TPA: hypothetical protein VMY88_00510 [Acidimicrobiales bacterium]|nr:hypothetical protein [Acidimicrobiales bacterium]
MSITDRQRTELYRAVEEAMGRDPADSLMALLPPVGWADVATKHDLSELERRIELRLGSLEDRLTARFEQAMRTYFVALLSSFAILLGVATAVTQQLS